jgi:hypothetical protein
MLVLSLSGLLLFRKAERALWRRGPDKPDSRCGLAGKRVDIVRFAPYG